MKSKTTGLQTRLYLISALILLIGIGCSTWIYLTNENDSKRVLGYEIAGGDAYLITPENSKKYVHDLELYGGKVNVLAEEFMSWFVGLWHGKSLAYTVGCMAVFLSLGFFFAARTLPACPEYDAHAEHDRDGSK
jgi:hypothetical protein